MFSHLDCGTPSGAPPSLSEAVVLMLLSPLIISQLSILPSSRAAFEGKMVLWVCLCPDWGFLECRDPTLVSSTVDVQGMSVEGMVNTCPYLHRGGGFL